MEDNYFTILWYIDIESAIGAHVSPHPEPPSRLPTQFFWFVQEHLNIKFLFYYFFVAFCFHFLLVGGLSLYNIVVVFAIHWHESAMDLHVFPIMIPPTTSLLIPSLWVFPVHQPWALVSCIQPGLVICFILDSILVSILFSQNMPPSPSPIQSQSLFCTSVSLFLFCI